MFVTLARSYLCKSSLMTPSYPPYIKESIRYNPWHLVGNVLHHNHIRIHKNKSEFYVIFDVINVSNNGQPLFCLIFALLYSQDEEETDPKKLARNHPFKTFENSKLLSGTRMSTRYEQKVPRTGAPCAYQIGNFQKESKLAPIEPELRPNFSKCILSMFKA